MTNTEQKRLIKVPIAVRWRDLDALNHVNNATFLSFVEEARLHWFASLDTPWFGQAWMPVVAAIHVNYRAQLAWPAQIAVELHCERLGNTSLTLAHRIVNASSRETLYADGNSVLVWVDPVTTKPVTLPEGIRRACQ